jgi:hypothetical protein
MGRVLSSSIDRARIRFREIGREGQMPMDADKKMQGRAAKSFFPAFSSGYFRMIIFRIYLLSGR